MYEEGDLFPLERERVFRELEDDFGIVCKKGGSLFKCTELDEVAERIARMRVKNPVRRVFCEPMPVEVEYELKRIRGKYRSAGIMYDGFEFLELMRELEKGTEGEIIILITDRFIGTYSEEDMRYHLRYSVMGGRWNIISLNGFIHAPAKPKEYYIAYRMAGDRADDLFKKDLEDVFGERILRKGDKRVNEVLKSAVFQVIFYALRGESFCEVLGCRLYNPHWQDELVVSMIKGRKEVGLCEKHRKMFREMGYGKN